MNFFYILKSVGIGPEIRQYRSLKLLVRTVLIQVKTPEQGLKALGPIPALLKSASTGPRDPIPTFKSQRFEALRKKNPRIGILTLSQRFLWLSQRF